MRDTTDFVLVDAGNIFILNPRTPAGVAWGAEHLPDDAQRWGHGYVVEHRFIEAIVQAAIVDGLEVEGV